MSGDQIYEVDLGRAMADLDALNSRAAGLRAKADEAEAKAVRMEAKAGQQERVVAFIRDLAVSDTCYRPECGERATATNLNRPSCLAHEDRPSYEHRQRDKAKAAAGGAQ